MPTYEWSPPHPAAVYIGLGLGLIVLLLLARNFSRSPTARSWSLLLLRAGVLAILLALLLNPVRVTETRLPPRPPEVVYLVDCSRSMALDRPTSRLEQVKQVIEQAGRRLPSDQQPRVNLYRFGQQLVAGTSLADLQADEDATLLRQALERLPARFEDGPPGGVVIFSDGRTTETSGFEEVAQGYRRLKVPLHVFPVGDPRVIGDVAIQDVIAPRDSPPGTRVPVRVVVRSKGYADQRTEIRIRTLADPARKPLATLPITLKDGVQSHELVVEPDPSGGKLVVEVPPFESEAIVENNRVPFQISSRKTKIRVIYMEGSTTGNVPGRREYQYLHEAITEDPNIECVSMEVDYQYAEKPMLHRMDDANRGFPTTREELFSYDVVICSDIKRTSFTQEQLDWVVELVAKRGGGFVMIGGNTSFGSGFWDKTVWDGLIPVDISDARGTVHLQTFRIQIPRAVERHPIWRIVDDPVKNRQILDQMPIFYGTNIVHRLKPAATALGYADRHFEGEDTFQPGQGLMPVFSCESFGQGRTFAMTTDTTYMWGQDFERFWGEGDNRYFRKFWRNVIHWLVENSAAGNRRLRIATDKVIYRPEQPVKISARAYDDKLEETSRYRVVARLRPSATEAQAPGSAGPALLQETVLAPKGSDLAYTGELTAPGLRQMTSSFTSPISPARVLALDVVAYDKDRIVSQATLDVQVVDDPVEFQDPQPDASRLEEIASNSGGKVLRNADELAQLLRSFTTLPGEVIVTRAPVWDRVPLWLLLVTLLAAEWILRRWWGLA